METELEVLGIETSVSGPPPTAGFPNEGIEILVTLELLESPSLLESLGAGWDVLGVDTSPTVGFVEEGIEKLMRALESGAPSDSLEARPRGLEVSEDGQSSNADTPSPGREVGGLEGSGLQRPPAALVSPCRRLW